MWMLSLMIGVLLMATCMSAEYAEADIASHDDDDDGISSSSSRSLSRKRFEEEEVLTQNAPPLQRLPAASLNTSSNIIHEHRHLRQNVTKSSNSLSNVSFAQTDGSSVSFYVNLFATSSIDGSDSSVGRSIPPHSLNLTFGRAPGPQQRFAFHFRPVSDLLLVPCNLKTAQTQNLFSCHLSGCTLQQHGVSHTCSNSYGLPCPLQIVFGPGSLTGYFATETVNVFSKHKSSIGLVKTSFRITVGCPTGNIGQFGIAGLTPSFTSLLYQFTDPLNLVRQFAYCLAATSKRRENDLEPSGGSLLVIGADATKLLDPSKSMINITMKADRKLEILTMQIVN